MKSVSWVLVLVGLAVGACEARTPDTSVSSRSVPEPGGTAVVGIPIDFDAFNEFALESALTDAFVSHVLFQTLVRYDGSGGLVGVLADSFDVAADGLSATFRLRENIRWHDGVRFTSDDVTWSFDVAIDEATAFPGRSQLRHVARAERIDERRIRFHFSRVHAEPLAAFPRWAPMPKHLLEDIPRSELRQAEFNRNPVGNGPYRFVSWRANERLVVEANEEFYGGRPHLDRIVFRIVPERTTLVTELLTGGVDLIPGIPPAELERVAASPEADILAYGTTTSVFLTYNTRKPLFEDPRVRRALTMAIDREAIVDGLLDGYGTIANGPVTPAHWAHDGDLEPLPHDPDGAVDLLAEAGWEDTDGDGWLDRDGRPFRLEMITNQDNLLRSSVLVVLQEHLRKIGVDVQTRSREFNVLADEFLAGTFESAVLGFVWPSRFDPSPLLLTGGPYNGGGYANPTADSLALRALATLERAEAEPLWHEYQGMVQEDHPVTWLFVEDARWGVSDRLRDVSSDAPAIFGVFDSVSRWWIPTEER